MRRLSDGVPARGLATALGLLCVTAIGVAAADRSPGTPRPAAVATAAPSTSTPPAQTSGYVGDDTCVTCHEAEGKALRLTQHGKSQN